MQEITVYVHSPSICFFCKFIHVSYFLVGSLPRSPLILFYLCNNSSNGNSNSNNLNHQQLRDKINKKSTKTTVHSANTRGPIGYLRGVAKSNLGVMVTVRGKVSIFTLPGGIDFPLLIFLTHSSSAIRDRLAMSGHTRLALPDLQKKIIKTKTLNTYRSFSKS